MKKWTGFALAVLLMFSSLAWAGGDQNQEQHQGDKGQGEVHQEQVNK